MTDMRDRDTLPPEPQDGVPSSQRRKLPAALVERFQQSMRQLDQTAERMDDARKTIRSIVPENVRGEVYKTEITGRHQPVVLPEGYVWKNGAVVKKE